MFIKQISSLYINWSGYFYSLVFHSVFKMLDRQNLSFIVVLLLFSSAFAVQLPIFPKITPPKVEDISSKLGGPKIGDVSIGLPHTPPKPNLDDLIKKLGEKKDKLKLEDIPTDTNLNDLITDIIYKGLIEYEEHQTRFPLLEWAVEQLAIPAKLFNTGPLTTIKNVNVCNGCAAVFKYLVARARLGINRDKLLDVVTFVCTLFHISTERVCKGAVDLNIDTLLHILREKEQLTELKVCSTIFQNFDCFKDVRTKYEVFIPNRDTTDLQVKHSSGRSFRILHITDFHLDPLYLPGGNAECGEPLCCQNDQGPSPKFKTPAGKWGDYRDCDMSYDHFTNFLEQITRQIQENGQGIDVVYFTGDVISHRVWNTSRKTNTEQIKKTYRMLKDYFKSIPVYSIIGNHEPHPLNVFSPPSITNEALSTRWIFDVMAEAWSSWLPSDTNETVRYGGYYTVLVKPGFRVIALNSNVCYTFNWWLLYEDVDPFRQLRWLSLTLKEAEDKNEFVHILSHVPPGDDTCMQEWTRQYRKIIERYAHIVKAQFNGHTHFDELKVFYNSSNPDQIINVAYNGGSFTTFNNLNPNYRYYSVDSDTYEILDYDQWTYDIDEANSKPNQPPRWFKLYSFKEAYGLRTMKYHDFENLINNMAQNHTLLELYYRYKVRAAAPSLKTGCTGNCQKDNLCSIVISEVDDHTQCKALSKHFGLLSKLNKFD